MTHLIGRVPGLEGWDSFPSQVCGAAGWGEAELLLCHLGLQLERVQRDGRQHLESIQIYNTSCNVDCQVRHTWLSWEKTELFSLALLVVDCLLLLDLDQGRLSLVRCDRKNSRLLRFFPVERVASS